MALSGSCSAPAADSPAAPGGVPPVDPAAKLPATEAYPAADPAAPGNDPPVPAVEPPAAPAPGDGQHSPKGPRIGPGDKIPGIIPHKPTHPGPDP